MGDFEVAHASTLCCSWCAFLAAGDLGCPTRGPCMVAATELERLLSPALVWVCARPYGRSCSRWAGRVREGGTISYVRC